MIPESSSYPVNFDTDDNLFLVRDSLRVVLAEDYNPGDTTIIVQGDTTNFPPTGLISLTEQCSDISLRAITFYYGIVTETTFEELELLPGYTDCVKPKLATNVTENVMAEHHDNIKNAIVAIEEFAGIKGTIDLVPRGATMEGRTNFLQNLVLRPRAWFSVNQNIGIVPLEVVFQDLSFRNPTYWKWCFGDDGTVSGVPSVISNVPSGISCVVDVNGGLISKTYYTPGFYDVSLTISNAFGEDTLIIEDMVNVRAPAPDQAVLQFTDINANNQVLTEDDSLATGAVLKSSVNTLIGIEVSENGGRIEDPIIEYIWKLNDNLSHFNSPLTQAIYDIGGLYDVKVRANTQFGAYRTTIAPNAIDIIENSNLWFSTFQNPNYAATKPATTYEFGLLSETFKVNNRNASPLITRDYSFLTGVENQSQQQKEFLRNNGFTGKNLTNSGSRGNSLFYWATGGTTWSGQNIKFMEYEGFSDCYATSPSTPGCNALQTGTIPRAWNWASFNTSQTTYFLLGNTNTSPDDVSSTNQTLTQLNLQSLTNSSSTFTSSNYSNGANELMNNVDDGANGNFSVYRTAWLNSTGFMLRNDANGIYFRIKSFYQTSGILSNLVQGISKLNDMPGTAKVAGKLVSLISGVYFFNNTGEVLAYSPTSATWSISSSNSAAAFVGLQDSTITSYSDPTITSPTALSYDSPYQDMVATSDGNRRAYISFDYSVNSFIKFDETTKTFSSLISRPSGEQWQMGIY